MITTVKKFIKQNSSIILFILCLTIVRLLLINKGHRFDLDERRYLSAFYFWIEIFNGKIHEAIGSFFTVQGRPGFVLVSLIPAGIQMLREYVSPSVHFDLHFFDVPAFFNVLVSAANAILFYRISAHLIPGRTIALAATIGYSLLVNTNIYIRHLFPYDYSLLCFFTVILLIIRREGTMSLRTAAICGGLTALGCLIYPGYYVLAVVVGLFLCSFVRFNTKSIISCGICFAMTILVFEGMSWFVGRSYLWECIALSGTITHGSFSEGFLFIVRYLKDVEGPVGFAWLSLFLVYALYFLRRERAPLQFLFGSLIIILCGHVILGVVFSKVVLYGRSLHMYFPFIILGAARGISLMAQEKWKNLLVIILVMGSMVSFMFFVDAYKKLSYPGDMYFKYLSNVPEDKMLRIVAGKADAVHAYSAVAVNISSYFDVPEAFVNSKPLPSMILMADEPHPLNFAAYTFENYTPQERRMLKERKYRMQVYADAQMANQKISGTSSWGNFFNKVADGRFF